MFTMVILDFECFCYYIWTVLLVVFFLTKPADPRSMSFQSTTFTKYLGSNKWNSWLRKEEGISSAWEDTQIQETSGLGVNERRKVAECWKIDVKYSNRNQATLFIISSNHPLDDWFSSTSFAF